MFSSRGSRFRLWRDFNSTNLHTVADDARRSVRNGDARTQGANVAHSFDVDFYDGAVRCKKSIRRIRIRRRKRRSNQFPGNDNREPFSLLLFCYIIADKMLIENKVENDFPRTGVRVYLRGSEFRAMPLVSKSLIEADEPMREKHD